jgi:hypothetical protein
MPVMIASQQSAPFPDLEAVSDGPRPHQTQQAEYRCCTYFISKIGVRYFAVR